MSRNKRMSRVKSRVLVGLLPLLATAVNLPHQLYTGRLISYSSSRTFFYTCNLLGLNYAKHRLFFVLFWFKVVVTLRLAFWFSLIAAKNFTHLLQPKFSKRIYIWSIFISSPSFFRDGLPGFDASIVFPRLSEKKITWITANSATNFSQVQGVVDNNCR